jgi:hypothetical protein
MVSQGGMSSLVPLTPIKSPSTTAIREKAKTRVQKSNLGAFPSQCFIDLKPEKERTRAIRPIVFVKVSRCIARDDVFQIYPSAALS